MGTWECCSLCRLFGSFLSVRQLRHEIPHPPCTQSVQTNTVHHCRSHHHKKDFGNTLQFPSTQQEEFRSCQNRPTMELQWSRTWIRMNGLSSVHPTNAISIENVGWLLYHLSLKRRNHTPSFTPWEACMFMFGAKPWILIKLGIPLPNLVFGD